MTPAAVSDSKRYVYGTHRARPPHEMLELIRPLARLAGVTRLANITGLDRVGIPTFSAVRPNAETLAVASGKGLTPDAARVSALMEAIELFHAEVAVLAEVRASAVEMHANHAACDIRELPMWRHAVNTPTAILSWTPGRDLLQDQPVYVPTELVLLKQVTRGLETFVRSSNGLASGCTLPEAILHALLEVVERDAVACHQLRSRRTGGGLPRVRLSTARNMPLVQQLLECFERAQVQPIVYDFSVDTRIPVYYAHIYDRSNRNTGVFYGSGAHLDPEIALLRALTEAAQSRLVYLAGTRDDFTSRQLATLQLQDTRALVDELESQPERVELACAASIATPSFDEDVRVVLQCLRGIGVQHAIAVELTLPEFGEALSVVRVVVPGLAGLDLRTASGAGHAERFATQQVAA